MDNVNIDGISNINVVKELFSSVKCIEEDNCILVVLNRDYVNSKVDNNKFLKTNIATDIAKEAINEFNKKLNDKEKIIFSRSVYCGYLINVVSNGIGVIPLKSNGQLIPKVKDFITDVDNYIFIGNDEINKIELQKLPLRHSVKKLAIFLKNLDNVCTPWTLPIKHKLVSYQEENYNKLVNKISR